jgi:hypothetical protein
VGSGTIPRWTWAHVVLVRSGDRVRVWLDGRLDIDVACPTGRAAHPPLFIGGRSDNDSNWEGRIDEVTVFDRALDEAAVARLRPSAPTTP